MLNPILQSINNLTLFLSAGPIAIPIIFLLIYKIYSLAPVTLAYVIFLVILTSLFAMRWVIYFIAKEKDALAALYREEKHRAGNRQEK